MNIQRRFLLLYAAVAVMLIQSAVAQDAIQTVSSTADQQERLAITIYNNNLGLVKEVREIELPQQELKINFMDVASSIIPSSVHVKSLADPNKFIVLEQNYEYDLISHAKLMDKYVGKDVKLIFKSEYDGTEEQRDAVLLSNNGGSVYKIGEEIHLGFPGRVILPKIPENLLARPTLVWMVDNRTTGPQNIEVSYLTNGISWYCDYVMILNQADTRIDLAGWVTISNNSGGSFNNAVIKLVAGDVRRVEPEADKAMGYEVAMMAPRAAKQFQEESFFEYHLYTLQRPATIKENQMKQILLMEASDVPVEKKLMTYGQSHLYTSIYSDPIKDVDVNVSLEFVNSEKNNLGMPLPKGLIRVYKADSSDMLQFVGENTIKHTPKDEKIELNIGKAFDVVAERKQLNWVKIRKDLYEVEWEMTVRNHKEEDVTVTAQESIPGEWSILETTHPYEKIASQTVHFSIPVKANGESVLRYKAQLKF
ncbi:MAG: DUF4139 domain-containing protein [Candidatus Auribacterota bacterium]